MDFKLEKIEKYNDDRGNLIVFLRESQLTEAKKKFGQIYFVTFKKKGVVRGNHYHKKWHEWFGIVEGKVEVLLEDVRSKFQIRMVLDSKHDAYVRLEIGPYVAHSFKSLTKYAALLNYADSEWAEEDSIRYKIKKNE